MVLNDREKLGQLYQTRNWMESFFITKRLQENQWWYGEHLGLPMSMFFSVA
jgi:hypothetical protein